LKTNTALGTNNFKWNLLVKKPKANAKIQTTMLFVTLDLKNMTTSHESIGVK